MENSKRKSRKSFSPLERFFTLAPKEGGEYETLPKVLVRMDAEGR